VEAKEAPSLPLLLVDIDGVISLFGFPQQAPPAGAFHWIDGVPHFLSTTAARHLLELARVYELMWASGWEEKADEYLPHLLGLPRGLPFLSFERPDGSAGRSTANTQTADTHTTANTQTADTRITRAHWKLAAIDQHAGPTRALAWIDDAFNDACHAWAAARPGPALLVATEPHVGLTEREVAQLRAWASEH
jgi:HAD domain in Swiss Army Knife RNA repair proteins